jgi:hypothetical protein
MSPSGSPKEAAMKMLQLFNPISIRRDREWGALLYRGADGKFYSTTPIKGGPFGIERLVAKSAPLVPQSATVVGWWHTHGAARSPRDELLSPSDINLTQSDVLARAKAHGVLPLGGSFDYAFYAAPSGTVYQYFPKPGDTPNSANVVPIGCTAGGYGCR